MASSALSLSFSHSHSVVGVSSLSTSATSTSSAPSLSYCGRGDKKIAEGKRFNHSFGNARPTNKKGKCPPKARILCKGDPSESSVKKD